jgi:transketolase
MAYGELGPTHHSIEDLSWLRAVAGLPIVVPADPNETRAAVRWAATNGGPSYLRIGRHPVPALHALSGATEQPSFTFGASQELRPGDDVTVIATGVPVSSAVEAADRLRVDGISVRVLNMSTIEPLDETAVLRAAKETRGVVTVEEATTTGGLGAAVASLLVQQQPTPMRILGIPRQFAPTGSADFLLEHFGLTSDHITDAARALAAAAKAVQGTDGAAPISS